MATVRLVTPASSATKSAAFFAQQLKSLGWPASIFKCISATDDAFNGDISKAADEAVRELEQALIADQDDVGVLVAAGTKAAGILQDKTTDFPIILALGGEAPSNAAGNNNLTGFVQDCVQIGKDHLTKHKQKGHTVTLLWDKDKDNQASQDVYKELIKIVPAKDLNQLTLPELSADKITEGFMLIPNATYYENSDLIARVVDLSTHVKEAYYPEIEYWRFHKQKQKAKVHGHSVELTYRQAANWVDYLLKEIWSIDDGLPQFTPAITEDYQWPP
jgi:hypothetical protein